MKATWNLGQGGQVRADMALAYPAPGPAAQLHLEAGTTEPGIPYSARLDNSSFRPGPMVELSDTFWM